MPTISIIVPVYNAERYLNRCINSILAQTYKDFELILVDDGSIDSSGKMCDEYAAKDSRIQVFHKTNGGVSSARNVGLDNASGEWITFCDADDWVDNAWLHNYSINTKDSTVYLIVQTFTSCGEFTVQNEEYTEYFGPVAGALAILKRAKSIGYLWVKCFRNEIISKNSLRFDEELNFLEDEDFVYRYLFLCKSGYAKLCDAYGYYYTVPNWDAKYKHPEKLTYYLKKSAYINFICKEEDPYGLFLINLSETTFFLFDGYANGTIVNSNTLREYKGLFGLHPLRLKNISIPVKIIYCLPVQIAHRLFCLKRRNQKQ